MLEFWEAVKESKYGEFLKKWWSGKYEFLDAWVDDLRRKYITGGLMFHPYHFVFNGAGFKGELNTKWEDGWEILEVIAFAPVLRREILPFELVIDVDIENEEKLIKRTTWIKAALDTLEIDYTLGFSGRRGFHFHVIVDPKAELPEELPPNFSGKAFKEALLNIIGNIAGFEGIDFSSTGIHSRHAIREFFSINEKTLTFKVPVEEIKIKKAEFLSPLNGFDDWEGYRIWKPNDRHFELIFEEIERMNKERERNEHFFEQLWRSKPRRKRTFGSRWKIERVKKYAEALKKYGKLTRDPEIAKRHDNEHMARVHLVLLMLELGMSDEEIHSVFRHAEDYNERRTQYFIDYNRKRLKEVYSK